MANKRVDQLTAATSVAPTDIIPIADPTTGLMKKATQAQLVGNTTVALTDGTTINWNYTNGNVASVILGGNRTLTLSNVPAGSFGILKVKQDSTGGRTLTLPGNKQTGLALSAGASQEDLLGFYNDGTNVYWTISNFGTVSGGGGGSYDTDSAAYFAAITTAGGSLTGGEKTAIDTFVIGLKSAAIWSKMSAIWPFAGSNVLSQKFNLKDPRDLDAAFRLNFVGTWTHDTTGAKAGSGAYADTFWTPGDASLLTSKHISIFPADNPSATANSIDMGSLISGGVGVSFISYDGSGTLTGNAQKLGAGGSGTSSQATPVAFWVLNRASSTRLTVWKNGTSILDNTAATNQSGTVSTSVIIGAYRSNGTVTAGSLRKYIFASYGSALSDAEVATFNTLVQDLKTALGR